MKLVFLGSGTSHGIPVIGCACPVCRSPDPCDTRTRASLYVLGRGGERLVIDTGPEFRLQALRAGITRLDGVLLTHAHADHLHGLDDIRPLSREKPLSIYGNGPALQEMRERFAYVFHETQAGGGKPKLRPVYVTGPFSIGGLAITPLPVKHGAVDVLGWKIEERLGGSLVYITDVSAIPAASLAAKPDMLILGAIRMAAHPTHFTFEQALDAARSMGAPRVYLTHLSHEHSHREIEAYCAASYRHSGEAGPARDGLELEFSEGGIRLSS